MTSKATGNKVGRPSHYRPEMLRELEEWAQENPGLELIDTCVARKFGVYQSTVVHWKIKYPEFSLGLQQLRRKAREHKIARTWEALEKRALGMKTKETKLAAFQGQFTDEKIIEVEHLPDVAAAVKYLSAKCPEARAAWSNQVELSGPKGQPIQTINANTTPEQAAAIYKQLILGADEKDSE